MCHAIRFGIGARQHGASWTLLSYGIDVSELPADGAKKLPRYPLTHVDKDAAMSDATGVLGIGPVRPCPAFIDELAIRIVPIRVPFWPASSTKVLSSGE